MKWDSWTNEQHRRAIGARADVEQMRGMRREVRPSIRPDDGSSNPHRDEARFRFVDIDNLLSTGTIDTLIL